LFIAVLTIQACQDTDFVKSDGKVSRELKDFRKTSSVSIDLLNSKLVRDENGRTPDYQEQIANLPHDEIVDIVDPLINSSISVIHSYGVTDAEIIIEFGSLTNPDLAGAGLAISRMEALANDGYTIEGFDDTDFVPVAYASFLGNPAFARTEAYDCALQAVGITAIVDLMNGGIQKLGKKGVMKVLKKVATKYLGWVGAAYALFEFADCMGAFDSEDTEQDRAFVKPQDHEIYAERKIRLA
jgi:hypothetical protein